VLITLSVLGKVRKSPRPDLQKSLEIADNWAVLALCPPASHACLQGRFVSTVIMSETPVSNLPGGPYHMGVDLGKRVDYSGGLCISMCSCFCF
jgi:hypothetical protein